MTEYNIRLNPNCATVVHTGFKFKSGDKGITFVIAVDELDTTDTTAKIVFMRANGTSVESDIIGTDGVYRYKTLGNEFAVPGKTVADVKFYAADERVSTASFVFDVSADTMSGLGAGTGGYSDRLEQLVTEAEEAGELTERAKAELEAAEKNLAAKETEISEVLKAFKEQYGEVGTLNPRGNWNGGVSYAIRDMVHYMGCSWICVVANKGNAPVEGSGYWMKNVGLEAGESGARNILPYPYYETTKTHNGITFVDNGDGSITCGGILGENGSYGYFRTAKVDRILKAGTYTASLYVDSFSQLNPDKSIFAWQFTCKSVSSGGTTSIVNKTIETTYTFTINEDCYVDAFISCKEANGKTYTVYLMLERGSVAHNWVPYHFGGAEHALDADTVDGWHIYTSPTEFGKTTKSTMSEIYLEMPTHSIFIYDAGKLTDSSWNFPNKVATLIITKSLDYRGWLELRHKRSGTYCMGVSDDTPPVPTGEWERYANADKVLSSAGGTIENTVATLLTLFNSNTTAGIARIMFKNANGNLGAIGMGTTVDSGLRRYNASLNKSYTMLDTGNMADHVLTKTGNGTLYGELTLNVNNAINGIIPNENTMILRNKTDTSTNTYTDLVVGDGVANLIKRSGGSVVLRSELLHTGNSNAVIKSATAPPDTTAMWYDTENNTWKRYVNGAWTAA